MILQRIPIWVLAIILACIAWLVTNGLNLWWLNPIAFVLPGALHRLNWRSTITAAITLAAIWWVPEGLAAAEINLPILLSYIAYKLPWILPIGLGEWYARDERSRNSLISVILTCVAAAAGVAILQVSIRCMGQWLEWPANQFRDLEGLTFWPLLSVVTWCGLAATFQTLRSSQRKTRRFLVATQLVLVGLYFLYFSWGIYPLAQRSLQGDGPFSRRFGALILAQRGSDSDYNAIWTTLKNSDWSRSDPESEHPLGGREDFRSTCLRLLAKHDSQGTAQQLAQLMEFKGIWLPDGAELLIKHQHYDCVPYLLRNAFLGNSTCRELLQQIRVPQVALAILYHEAAFGMDRLNLDAERKRRNAVADSNQDIPMSPEVRHQLVELLGDYDADTYGPWFARYEEVIHGRPTPLATDLAEEVNRVAEAMGKFYLAKSKDIEVRNHKLATLARQKMIAAGHQEDIDLLDSIRAKALKDNRLPEKNYSLMHAIETYESFLEQAALETPDISVNLDAQGVEGLERAIEDYSNRVEQAYQAEFPDEARPPTSKILPL